MYSVTALPTSCVCQVLQWRPCFASAHITGSVFASKRDRAPKQSARPHLERVQRAEAGVQQRGALQLGEVAEQEVARGCCRLGQAAERERLGLLVLRDDAPAHILAERARVLLQLEGVRLRGARAPKKVTSLLGSSFLHAPVLLQLAGVHKRQMRRAITPKMGLLVQHPG